MAHYPTSLSNFVDTVQKVIKKKKDRVFFRGHSNEKYLLLPSLFREKQYIENERNMLLSLITEAPEEFAQDAPMFEKLVRAQHYGLPTRMLDFTTNPLIALYFACITGEETNGDVIVLEIPEKRVRFFDSDRVSCKSHLSLMSYDEKHEMFNEFKEMTQKVFGTLGNGWGSYREQEPKKWKTVLNQFNETQHAKRLVHLIRQEKSYFENRIDPMDLIASDVVLPKRNNARLAAQSGCFLLYGLWQYEWNSELAGTENRIQARLTKENHTSTDNITILPSRKKSFLHDLETIGISSKTVYPELDKIARHIRRKYSG